MEVVSGYKQTEVGVMPEDWRLQRLGDLIDPFRDIRYGIVQPGKYDPKGRYMVRGQDYSKGWGDPSQFFRVTASVEEPFKNARIKTGDILITIVGAGTGRIAIVPRWLDGANLTQTTARLAIDPSKALNSYCGYVLSSWYGLRQVDNYIKGGAQPGLNCCDVGKFLIPLPPTKAEQEAIADALSDSDALIESLEQLIAKKRQLKQGTMQELLAGKRGLYGFANGTLGYKQTEVGLIPGNWDTPELGKILTSMQLGGNYKNSERETNWPLIKMGNLGRGSIKLDKLEFIDSTQGPLSRDRLEIDDVIFNTRNTLDLVGKVAIWRNELPEAYFNSNIMRMKFEDRRVSSYRFMNYVLNTSRSLKALRGIAIGTTSVAAIYGRDLVKLKIPLPTKAEQEAIAEVLSNMDAEIAALESKLTKASQLKQGMIHSLLTGRIRLL